MFVFIIANLPLPIIFLLNIRVTLRFLKVRHLTRHMHMNVDRPERLVTGWWLGNISNIFAFTPMLWERRLFVQNHWWILSYGIAATLSITGLLLMNSGLGEELRELTRLRRHRNKQ